MNKKKNIAFETVPKSTRKIVECGKIDIFIKFFYIWVIIIISYKGEVLFIYDIWLIEI